jgi:uncharacterized membrane protein HdeD (DUF308 family)
MATETANGIRASQRSIVWGALMLFCGVLAIFLPLASVALVNLLGWLILISAVWHLIFAFQTRGLGNILWQVLLAIPYAFVGFYMLSHPLLGMLTLTFVLAMLLLFEGVLEIVFYFNIRTVRNAGWVLLDGIITLILGFLIWAHLPSTSVWVIGTLVGISLIFAGISRIMLSSGIRRLTSSTT